MRRLAFAILLTTVIATPAGAQIVGRHDYGYTPPPNPLLDGSQPARPTPRSEVRDLRGRIDAAYVSGHISRRDARRLTREAGVISSLAHRYGRDGFSEAERRELETRAHLLRAEIASGSRRRR